MLMDGVAFATILVIVVILKMIKWLSYGEGLSWGWHTLKGVI
jgi:hypothetical protein